MTLLGWIALGVVGVVAQYRARSKSPAAGTDQPGSRGQGPRRPDPEFVRPTLNRRRAQAMTGHRGSVKSIIWDPYGRWFATAGEYGDVYLWDAASGRALHQLWGSDYDFRDEDSLRVSPDGSWLAAYPPGGKRWIWDTATGRLLAGPDSEPGDNRYARSVDPSGNIWDGTAWARIPERERRGWTGRAADPNGRWLASRDDRGRIRIWDTSSERQCKQMFAGLDILHCLAMVASGDGRWLIYQGGLLLDFWLVDRPRPDQSPPFHGTPGLEYHDFGKRVGRHRFAVTGREERHTNILQMWELSDVPKLLWQTGSPQHQYSHVLAASPTGQWLACESHNLEIRDAATGEVLQSFARSADVYAAVFTASPDGKALAVGYHDGSVALFDLVTGTCRHRMPGHRRSLRALAMAPDASRLAAAGTSGVVCFWNPATGRQIELFKGLLDAKQDGVSAMAASHDGSWLAIVYSIACRKLVIIRDIRTAAQRPAIHLFGFVRLGERLAWTPDGTHLTFWDSDTGVYLLDSRSGEKLSSCEPLWRSESLLAHLDIPFGRPLASGFLFENLSVWGRYHEQLAAQAPKGARQQSWGKSLDFAIRVALRLARYIGLLPGPTSIEGIAPSPDSTWLATPGKTAGISVRDSRTGKVLHELQGHQGSVKSLAIHPDGRYLFSAGLDGVIRRWDMAYLPAKPVCDLAMEALPDDNWVVWNDPDGPNRCWDDKSPGAKRWLGWHAPIEGTDRWGHQDT